MATSAKRVRQPRPKAAIPAEMTAQEVMMLAALYAEEKGGPRPSPWPDDGAYKSWNHYWDLLRRRRLIKAATRAQIQAGFPPPSRITAKGIAAFERVRSTPGYPAMLAAWEESCAVWRRNEERSDAERRQRSKDVSDRAPARTRRA